MGDFATRRLQALEACEKIINGIEDGEISQKARAGVDSLLSRSFRPEFLNRLDEIIYFKPLTKENITAIVDLCLDSLRERLSESRIGIKVTDAAKEYIINTAYDPVFGARPLKRFIQSNIETLAAKKIISGDLPPESEITIDYDGKNLIAK